MDFFASQDAARRKTGLLIAYLALAVVVLTAALYLVAAGALVLASDEAGARAGRVAWWQPDLFALVTVVTLAIISGGSLYKMVELRGGGEQVATMLGGRRIPPNTTDLAERRLLNVVEEMALASGVPVPPVFVLDHEESINAFAAGFTPGDAVIGVNRGTLDYLSRDELQGIIAHEFSHILNGDMRLNLRLIGLLHGILLIAIGGYYALRIGSRVRGGRDSRGAAAFLVVMGLAAIVIGYSGVFFARLIKAAVSRQREYLADAAAVQFTRNPDGIAGALKKIGGLAAGSRLETPEAEVASHMFFASAFRQGLFAALATHPPLVERIRRIDPGFDGTFLPVRPYVEAAPAAVAGPAARPGLSRMGMPRITPGVGEKLPLDPALVLTAVGTPETEHVAYASHLIAELQPALAEALHEPFSARAVVFALLLDPDPEIRAEQLRLLRQIDGPPAEAETLRLAPLVEVQDETGRLPLIEMAQGTLRGLSPGQYDNFRASVERLVRADRKISLFEFVLQLVLLTHLDRHFQRRQPPAVRYHSPRDVQPEIAVLLSTLAHAGHLDAHEAAHAFAHGIATLPDAAKSELLPREACTWPSMAGTLEKLSQSAPSVKKAVLGAAAATVAADGRAALAEVELLRAVAEALDCPMPPIAAGLVTAAAG